MAASPTLPGRLGNPSQTMRNDPRSDPRMIEVLAPLEMADPPPEAPVDSKSPLDALRAYCDEFEAAFEQLGPILYGNLPPISGVNSETQGIKGVDGNDIPLYIHRPSGVDGPVPCVIHTHGGGMVMLQAAGPGYVRWRDELAATGLVAVGVEFRNGAGALGPHPFPAGLNDCASAVSWVHENREQLGISKIVISGESGGGNLALATALKANREGWIDKIDGVYAQCPYIANAWDPKSPELPSLFENDQYMLSVKAMGALARVYDPSGEHDQNPLAWPLHASRDDLAGLPPHVISVNELDPLRDEGLAFFRKLLDAGVDAVGRTVNGTCHAGDCMLRGAMPDVYLATIRDIQGFAASL